MSSMSIEEAREILGREEGSKLSDEQLQDLIWRLESLASMTIKAIINGDMKIPETEND